MIKWTTPILRCSIPTELVFEYILLTLKQGNTSIEKTILSDEVVDGKFDVVFSQEETGQFQLYKEIEAQLNIMNGDVRVATNIVKMKIERNLHDEIIGDEES